MLNIEEIRELIKVIDETSIDEFKYEHSGVKVTMKKNSGANASYSTQPVTSREPQGVEVLPQHNETPDEKQSEGVTSTSNDSPEAEAVSSAGLHTITSPMVGTFYNSPSPDSDPYVKKGDRIGSDSVVCIVEAMKLMNEIEAEVKGEIVEVLVENGQLVEYGQELFLVKPE
ncbi:acetyl-CoA carboxylase biotin carboxyl carrier protein [Salipaludibacillus sp. LMS25]|jgi:acetyl-CoA carboxylase biotin carboxyl carrier protein|uniref:acetyl-CoA carboxylase biotin carboxyl carrier protein n=1 Tax=Salipaludibacillus sp. LMS25 TaxID=2924031 RepID=UPI0020D1EA8B|nr:acetyl-CoA carboxylase biotin carboxyl carrier protein [Salipaludibacillus sp. LMS25]UTR14486.1 acetyl-CoA carboxylase biotin carboxyl carrier protein [Salipaludibacillus sp. LMS25]